MNQKKITDYFRIENIKNNQKNQVKHNENSSNDIQETEEIIYGYNPKTGSNHCTLCGIDMGPMNPRQLCGKIFCYSEDYK